MNRPRRFFLVLALVLLGLARPFEAARADGAPPPVPPGSVGPAIEVRMMSEAVTVTVESHASSLSASWPQDQAAAWSVQNSAAWTDALVDASFTLRNLSDQEEDFDIWFPLGTPHPGTSDQVQAPETISAFAAWLDGKPEQITLHDLSQEHILEGWEGQITWASWPARFPPGQDVVARVQYRQVPDGNRPQAYFTYVLETGAGWKGTIGEGTVTVKLPYDVTPDNTMPIGGPCPWDMRMQRQACHPKLQGKAMIFHFSDLDPTLDDNVVFCTVEPGRWAALLAARKAAAASPDSALAQLQLGVATARATLSYGSPFDPYYDSEADLYIGDTTCGIDPDQSSQPITALDRFWQLAPQDRADVYHTYVDALTNGGSLDPENRDDQQALLDALARDFAPWPSDPVYGWLQALAGSPDYRSYFFAASIPASN